MAVHPAAEHSRPDLSWLYLLLFEFSEPAKHSIGIAGRLTPAYKTPGAALNIEKLSAIRLGADLARALSALAGPSPTSQTPTAFVGGARA